MRKGKLVLHTHWDREWRYPLWENRMYLCNMVDELLHILDTQPDYRSFVMDGQTVIIEDYLEVRPENREKIENISAKAELRSVRGTPFPIFIPFREKALSETFCAALALPKNSENARRSPMKVSVGDRLRNFRRSISSSGLISA